jgi:hypothetical protein
MSYRLSKAKGILTTLWGVDLWNWHIPLVSLAIQQPGVEEGCDLFGKLHLHAPTHPRAVRKRPISFTTFCRTVFSLLVTFSMIMGTIVVFMVNV